MPSSTQKIITPIMDYVIDIQPKTILDIGIGYGKWGFLCREYLESWRGRINPDEWQIEIDGIEIFKPYIELGWQKYIYNRVFLGNVKNWVDSEELKEQYELVIACDVIEHLEYNDAKIVMEKLIRKGENTIFSIPIGKEWLNNVVVGGNEAEKHQSYWNEKEIADIGHKAEVKSSIFTTWETRNGRKGVIAYFRR